METGQPQVLRRTTRCTLGLVSDHEQVLSAERALQAAQLAGDVDELDRLLHPDLLAVGPDGSLVDKAADLAAHRSGVLEISELQEEELRVIALGELAVTFVLVRIRARVEDDEVAGRMRYTRTWTRADGAWRVVAAHISLVPD
jgi:ketosteroid isomerase-like protein